jgi:DNA-binding response OmpR family regulator
LANGESMNILVVEDNPEMSEALCDILQQNGHRTETASTSAEAGERLSFAPEVIIWDADVGKGNLPAVLGALGITVPKYRLIIIARDVNNIIGTFNSGWVKKPFKTAEILNAIGPEDKDKEKARLLKKAKGRNDPHVGIDDMGLKFGTSYLFQEREPNKLRKGCRQLSKKEDDILYITSGNVKAVRELMRKDGMMILALSEKEGKNYLNGAKIGSVANKITSFIKTAKRPVVVLDDLRALIDMNDMSAVLTMIGQTIKNSSEKQVTLLASIDPESITEKEKTLMLKHMVEYR